MTEGEKLLVLMIKRFLDENPDKEIVTYVHMVDGEYRHEVEIREKNVKTA